MKNTTDDADAPMASVERTARQSSTTDRLSDYRLPLSVDEDRAYGAVVAAVYFLRKWRKKVSASTVLSIFQATKDSLRKSDVCAYLRRLDSIEALKNQGGNRSGTAWEPKSTYDGTDFEHDGNRSQDDAGTVTGTKNRVSSLTANININTSRVCAPARELKTPTDEESRILDVCYQWSLGVSLPMPADLVERYRAMIATHNLPRRPGT